MRKMASRFVSQIELVYSPNSHLHILMYQQLPLINTDISTTTGTEFGTKAKITGSPNLQSIKHFNANHIHAVTLIMQSEIINL